MTEQTIHNQPTSHNAHRRFAWLKRLGFALLMPIALCILGAAILALLGGDSSDKIADTLQSIWLPLSVLRLLAYIVVAYWLVPMMLRRKRQQSLETVQYWQQRLKQYQANHDNNHGDDQGDDCEAQSPDLESLQWLHNRAQQQQRAYEQLLQHRYRLLLIFLLFEVITVQLPFWLK